MCDYGIPLYVLHVSTLRTDNCNFLGMLPRSETTKPTCGSDYVLQVLEKKKEKKKKEKKKKKSVFFALQQWLDLLEAGE